MAVVLCLLSAATQSRPARSHAAITAFKAEQPCPATGKARGACPGHQVDHVTPLCAGGFDRPDNLQWLPIEHHRVKTRTDVAVCAKLRALDRRQ